MRDNKSIWLAAAGEPSRHYLPSSHSESAIEGSWRTQNRRVGEELHKKALGVLARYWTVSVGGANFIISTGEFVSIKSCAYAVIVAVTRRPWSVPPRIDPADIHIWPASRCPHGVFPQCEAATGLDNEIPSRAYEASCERFREPMPRTTSLREQPFGVIAVGLTTLGAAWRFAALLQATTQCAWSRAASLVILYRADWKWHWG
jgi:hypothetical protein